MNTPSYKAWLIDLDGTLYRAKWLKLAMAAELLLTGPFALSSLKTFRKGHEELREESREHPDKEFLPSAFEEQLRRAAERNGQEVEKLRELVNCWMIEKPGKWLKRARREELISEIEAFRAAGGKTALVSDYPARSKLEAMELSSLFDRVVANGEHPKLTRLKPAPDAFQIAAAELGAQAEECLVIGDREDADGEAARRAGMAFRLIS